MIFSTFKSRFEKQRSFKNLCSLAFLLVLAIGPANVLIASDSFRHSIAASGATGECWDCVVAGFDDIKPDNGADLRTVGEFKMHSVAIFSNDPDEFVSPITRIPLDENPELNAIGVLKVTGFSNHPPHNATDAEETAFKPGAQIGLGSGTVIDSCLVLTNHHVARIKRKKSEISNVEIEFYAGPTGNGQNSFEFVSKGTIVAEGNLQYDSDMTNDWAIVRLDNKIYDANNPNDPRFRWRMEPQFLNYDEAVTLISHGAAHRVPEKYIPPAKVGDTAQYIPGQIGCEVLSEGNGVQIGMWKTNCPSMSGMSGSAIWQEGYRLIALTQASLSENDEENLLDLINGSNLNLIIPISAMFTPAQLELYREKFGCD